MRIHFKFRREVFSDFDPSVLSVLLTQGLSVDSVILQSLNFAQLPRWMQTCLDRTK